jgi:hypothetical protein
MSRAPGKYVAGTMAPAGAALDRPGVKTDEPVKFVMEPAETYFCVPCQHFPGGEKNHETPSSKQPAERSRFEPGTSRI